MIVGSKSLEHFWVSSLPMVRIWHRAGSLYVATETPMHDLASRKITTGYTAVVRQQGD